MSTRSYLLLISLLLATLEARCVAMEPGQPAHKAKTPQKELRSQLEINGVFEHPNENLHYIAILIAQNLGVDLKDHEIDYVIRIGAKRPRPKNPEETNLKPRPILMRLLRKTKREQILLAARAKKHLNSQDINLPGPLSRIFVNERLTNANRALYYTARTKAKEFKFEQCFIATGGSVFIKKSADEAPIRIRNLEELDKAVGLVKDPGPKILDYRYLYDMKPTS